jgi:hypothetical protein
LDEIIEVVYVKFCKLIHGMMVNLKHPATENGLALAAAEKVLEQWRRN